jgi:hypothetical protein
MIGRKQSGAEATVRNLQRNGQPEQLLVEPSTEACSLTIAGKVRDTHQPESNAFARFRVTTSSQARRMALQLLTVRGLAERKPVFRSRYYAQTGTGSTTALHITP